MVKHVTVPPGTVMKPNQNFRKIWRVRNDSACTWTPEFYWEFDGGYDSDAPWKTYIPHNVNPGETIDITVPMSAPMMNGTYRGNWLLRNPSGQLFGMGADGCDGVWVDIRVQGGGVPTVPGSEFACQYIETRYDPSFEIDAVYKVYLKNTGMAVWSKTDVGLIFESANGSNADFFLENIGEIRDLHRNVALGEIVEIGEYGSPVSLHYFKEANFLTTWRLTNNSETICVFNGLSNITGSY